MAELEVVGRSQGKTRRRSSGLDLGYSYETTYTESLVDREEHAADLTDYFGALLATGGAPTESGDPSSTTFIGLSVAASGFTRQVTERREEGVRDSVEYGPVRRTRLGAAIRERLERYERGVRSAFVSSFFNR